VVITLMLRLQLHWSTRLQTYYTLALDYFYWVGARAAQRDIRRSSPAARSTPASEHRP
jgi:hypothetical protein